MAENRVTMDEFADRLRQRTAYSHARNLIMIALPLATAHQQANELAGRLNAQYLDFDCELISKMEADNWNDHLEFERHGTLSIGRMLAEKWLKEEVRQRINTERSLVIGNINLAVLYDIDLANILYDSTERGVCIIAAGGRIQGQTLLIHGSHPQTGAGSPTYELATPTDTSSATDLSHSVQDRLI